METLGLYQGKAWLWITVGRYRHQHQKSNNVWTWYTSYSFREILKLGSTSLFHWGIRHECGTKQKKHHRQILELISISLVLWGKRHEWPMNVVAHLYVTHLLHCGPGFNSEHGTWDEYEKYIMLTILCSKIESGYVGWQKIYYNLDANAHAHAQ